MWFADSSGSIGRMTTDGATTSYALPDGAKPADITAGPDGALWFTDAGRLSIGRITTSGDVRDFSLPTKTGDGIGPSGGSPGSITVGPDDALWYVQPGSDRIGRVTTGGEITEFDLPTRGQMHVKPSVIRTGPDGSLWFGQPLRNSFGRFNPFTREFVEVAYQLPAGGAGVQHFNSFAWSGSSLWYPAYVDNAVGRVNGNAITHFRLPTHMAGPELVAGGGDGAIWFSERGANRVARITESGELVEFPPFKQQEALRSAGTPGPGGTTWFAIRGGLAWARCA